jgi:DNA mismatch repair protein MutL
MSVIRVLPEQISNRIAAGEVIERPASVVKELVENALDAEASSIKVSIESAGSKLIAVVDNGRGMDGDDALLCLEAHATSKIAGEKDIHEIITYGFRGEAMPSIASVSRFSLRTRRHEDPSGTEVTVRGGAFVSSGPAGCAPGTEIMVRDIFFNTPARKKFMRAKATEEKHIQEALYLMALPNPEVSFELSFDGRQAFSSPAHNSLQPRITSFFGSDYADNMLEINHEDNGIKVSGYIARHGFTRNTRREQRTFVNNRGVESPAIFRGLRDGYGGMVEKGRYPPALLFVNLDPILVDVNVHPAKKEVRFRSDWQISHTIAEAIRRALSTTEAPTVNIAPEVSLRSMLDGAEISYQRREIHPELTFPDESVVDDVITPIMPEKDDTTWLPLSETTEDVPAQTTEPATRPESIQVSKPELPPQVRSSADGISVSTLSGKDGGIRILGALDDTYIMVGSPAGLLIVDQHAAHERILFEKLLEESRENSTAMSQQLLIPITLELSRAETAFLEKNLATFNKLGYELDFFGGNTAIVNGVPHVFSQGNVGGALQDIISDLAETGRTGTVDLETAARSACRAAVKAHDNLTDQEIKNLLTQMSECTMPFCCPHGRPTVICISIRELERRFSRR